MAPRPQDLYGTFGSVPNVENQGVSSAHFDAHANANTFGAGVGEAITNFAGQSAKIAEHFGQMSVESKVKDDYANKYIPAALELKKNYELLRGQDKVTGYDNYINNLTDLNKDFVAQQPGQLGQDAMGNLVNSHTIQERKSAQSDLVASQKQFNDQSTYDMLNANKTLASSYYNDPVMVKSLEQQNNNHILIQYIDNGHDPNNPASASMISAAQRENTGQMAVDMISTAIRGGDSIGANNLRANYANTIPGYIKLNLDNTIHTQNIQQTSIAGLKSLHTGEPFSEAIGAPASRVQALIADTARSGNVDINNALTVLRIESADGQNLGGRGTLGQDKESKGKPIEEQALALVNNLRTANNKATEILGRQAEAWEGYIVYQQGVGGGPALLKAAQDNPDARAIDILAPLYKDRDDAIDAVIDNGGNVTMTASDFVDHLKQLYNDNGRRAESSFGDATTPGDSILKSRQQTGVTVQPGATPVQSLLNFNKRTPELLARINAIPNLEERAGVMEAFKRDQNKYQESASAYTNAIIAQATELAADPNFTSLEQIPTELYSALNTVHPETLGYMERRLKLNMQKRSGYLSKDMNQYGNSFYDLFNAIHSEGPEKITSIAQLQRHAGKDITIAGYDRLVKELQGKNTPDGEAEGMMKKQFFANAKAQISGSDDILGIKDPKGDEIYLRFMAQALPAFEKGKTDGKSATQLLDPASSDYIGKSISSFKRTLSEQLADMNQITANLDTPEGLKDAVAAGKISREEATKIALERGYIRSQNNITVPLAID